jgi:5-formyltetrahydrofolate cyclo-ligase
MADDLTERKAQLRTRVRQALRSMDPGNRAEEAVAIRNALRTWPAWVGARTVLGFLPLAAEVDLRPLLAEAIGRGVMVAVPVSDADGSMRPCRLASLEAADLETDAMGIAVPRRREPVATDSIDVVIVPGLAFDPQGRRLGRGGGFYDRFLPSVPRKAATVGVCFGLQRVEAVPAGPSDARVEWLAGSTGVAAAQPVSPI